MGRRTEKFCCFWHKNRANQKFLFIDICLLYPYINSNCDCPVGHADEIFIAPIFDNKKDSQFSLDKRRPNPECDRDDSINSLPETAIDSKILSDGSFGLIKCVVLPQRQLLAPILPLKFASKLFFTFCKSCFEVSALKQLTNCSLVQNPNMTTLKKEPFGVPLNAYRMVDVSDVRSTKKEKLSKEFFTVYNNTSIELKTEASGWPPCKCNVDNENQLCRHKLQYSQDYEQRENIKLDTFEVNRTEGLPFISKTFLNSCMGYLGMRENLPKTHYNNTYSEYVKFCTSSITKILDAALIGDELMPLRYQMIEDASH